MGGDAVFLVKNATKKYGSRLVLRNICLEVRRGEILGIIGASGAGKSTLLHMLVGFVPSSAGEILFRPHANREYNVLQNQQLISRYYGFASQHQSFYEKLTVMENLRYFGEMYDLTPETIEQNANQLLQFINLKSSAHLLAMHLSGGMKRRLDIACALIHNPHVIILDEPTADLDPVLRNHIWEVIKQINAKGTTVILSSHHLNDLDALCGRIAIIKDGELADIDTPEKLKNKYKSTVDIMIESFPGNYDQVMKRLGNDTSMSVTRAGTYLTIRTRNVENVIGRVLAVLKRERESLLDLKLIKPNLDDVYVSIYSTKKVEAPSP